MIIITGASKGIGRYLFESYVDNTEVAGTYLTSAPIDHPEEYHSLDVSDYQQVADFFEYLRPEGEITLINCAGINYNSLTHKSDPDEWKKVIDVNLIGTYNMIRKILPYMRGYNFGRIINFSSVTALKPTPGASAYAASKAALWGMTRSIAVENASHGITINNINMGYSELGMIGQVPEKYMNFIIDSIPEKRVCPSEDILNTVEYLRNTSYITGSSIDLNGGLV